MLKLKFKYFGHLMGRTDSGKDPDAGKDWRQEEKKMTEDEMVEWHHLLDRHEFEQAQEVGCGWGEGSLVWPSSRHYKEWDITKRLNRTDVREDARVCSHWINSFDMSLSYLGPVSWVIICWVSLGLTKVNACGLMTARCQSTISNDCNILVYWAGRKYSNYQCQEHWHSLSFFYLTC